MGGGLSPPPVVVIPVPLVAALAFPCLALLACLAVVEVYELHKLVRAAVLGLSGIGLIENIVNRGPFATSGSTDTINANRWTVSSGDFTVSSLPSMRMIVDVGDFTQSVTVHTTGESGHPYSQHYDDMIDLWCNMGYYPMLWTREQVESATVNRLILNPGDCS